MYHYDKLMKIKHITIDNYRILKHVDIDFQSNVNVFIGINGAGKSTILHAVRILISWFIARMQTRTGRGLSLTDKDITHGEDSCRLVMYLDNGIKWMLFKRRSSIRKPQEDKTDLSEMNGFIRSFYDTFTPKNESLTHVPMIAYYGVDRAVTNVPSRVSSKHLLNPLDIYTGFGDEKLNFRSFFEWFKEREDIENEEFRNNNSTFEVDKQLEAVRLALESALPEYKNLRIRRNPRAILIDKNGEKFNFDELSDGEKCYITLIGDIARKLAMANPQTNNSLNESGIVFIDEIDLHLHPSWQQNVIDNLTRAFSNVQFIITTHSPFIISSTKKSVGNQIVILNDGELQKVYDDVYGSTVEDVLLGVFGLKTVRNVEVQNKIDKVWTALQSPSYNKESVDNDIQWLRDNIDRRDDIFAQFALQQALLRKQKKEDSK